MIQIAYGDPLKHVQGKIIEMQIRVQRQIDEQRKAALNLIEWEDVSDDPMIP